MRINHNIAALNTYRQLSANNANGAKSTEKLSSGLRINRAGDDAAGLAISEKMRAQIRGLDQASRNAQDGISMIQTTEGALNETHSILQRMRELATQSSSDTNVAVDREEIQKEMNQLTSEINRIGNSTEFNNQKLLKGTNQAAKTTAAATATVSAGQTGAAAGALSALQTNAKSVVGVSSTATVQAGTSAATGSISNFAITATSTAAVKGTLTSNNGISFQENVGGALNGKTIEIAVATTANQLTTSSQTATGWKFTIGTDGAGKASPANSGELYAAIDSEITAKNYVFKVNVPTLTNTALSSIATTGTPPEFSGGVAEKLGAYNFDVSAFKEAGDTIDIGGVKFTAVIGNPAANSHEFSIGTDAAAANLVTPGTIATNLKAAIANDVGLNARFAITGTGINIILTEQSGKATGVDLTSPTVAGGGTDDKLTITNAGGRNLKTVTLVQGSVLAASGTAAVTTTTDTLFKVTAQKNSTELNGVSVKFGTLGFGAGGALTSAWDATTRTLTVSGSFDTANATAPTVSGQAKAAIESGLASAGFKSAGTLVQTDGSSATAVAAAGTFSGTTITFGSGNTAQAANSLTVDSLNGDLKIYLASDNASENTAAKIQAAIQALGNVGGNNDFTKYTAQGSGSWDTGTRGNDITKGTSTLVGGTQAVNGNYKMNIDKAFAVGDNVVVKGQVFKAVANGADSTKGEFNVNAGNTAAQASSLIDAINLNASLAATYSASSTGSTITLSENQATGTDLKASELKVTATGVAGQFTVDTSELLTDGASISVDGQKISVSKKDSHVGYANGTAIKETGNAADQTKAIAEAINKNASLKQLYAASVNAEGKLQLDQKVGNTNAPDVKMTSSTKGSFEAAFQIGANSGQSMTIVVDDMRAASLGISGDGSTGTVAAKNGAVASYAATANISDGTTNKNTEFSLDVSTSAKASAAISVLNDAIENVSGQRSQLGAYQNRLEHTINNLGTSSENLTAAESRIRDVDMAKEIMENTKNNILAQAAQAMLAQANQAPQGVLQLLR